MFVSVCLVSFCVKNQCFFKCNWHFLIHANFYLCNTIMSHYDFIVFFIYLFNLLIHFFVYFITFLYFVNLIHSFNCEYNLFYLLFTFFLFKIHFTLMINVWIWFRFSFSFFNCPAKCYQCWVIPVPQITPVRHKWTCRWLTEVIWFTRKTI